MLDTCGWTGKARTFPSDCVGLEQGRRWRVGREGTPVLTVVAEDGQRRDGASLLDDIFREGARRTLAAALEAEMIAATFVQFPNRYIDCADGRWDGNVAFISHAREDIPRLLAEIRRLKEQLQQEGSNGPDR
jgi:hypothetical protein